MNPLKRLREAGAASTMPALVRGTGDDDPNIGTSAGDGTGTSTDANDDGTSDIQTTPCPTCGGTGVDAGELCTTCKGSGQAQDPDDIQDMSEADGDTKQCPVCGGDGKIGASLPCNACKGTGTVPSDWAPKPKTGNPFAKSKEAQDVFAAMEERLAALESKLSSDKSLRESKPDFMGSTFDTMTRVTNSQGQQGYEVVLIREGLGNESDNNWYTGAAIKEMCESGRAEGMQAYANHPDLEEEELRPERDVRHLIGVHTDVKFAEANGKGVAKSVFDPLNTNEKHPTYGWVTTLAEAAVRNKGPQPLVGWSLYGLSGGDIGTRPDGSEGRVVDLIMPTSGDMVTNAGAGGEFARNLMIESARRLRRANTPTQEEPMLVSVKMAEAKKALREATTDEARDAALQTLDAVEKEVAALEVKPQEAVAGTAVLTEAAIAKVREAALAEQAGELDELRVKLREANGALGTVADVMNIDTVLRANGVEDDVERKYFTAQARQRGLREAEDIKDLVETERAYQAKQENDMLARVREAMGDDYPQVEGAVGGFALTPASDGGVAALREAGIPTKEPVA